MKKGYDTFGIAVSLTILVLFIAVFLVFIYSKTKNDSTMNKNATNKNKISNEKSNEKFEDLNARTEILNLDNLLDAFKNPSVVSEMVASISLENGIKSIQSSINTMNTEIENLKKKEQLPKGSIMLWYKEGTPNKNWVPCDGATYFVQYEDGNEENGVKVPDFRGKFVKGVGGDASVFNSGGSDKIIEKHIPKHRHPLNGSGNQFPSLKHNHTGSIHNSTHNHNIAHDTGGGGSYGSTKNKPAEVWGGSSQSDYAAANVLDYYAIQDHTHSHGLSISESLSSQSEQIARHIIGEGPMYQGEQQKFEPLYQEAKFIYYLGNLLKEPTQTIGPTNQ